MMEINENFNMYVQQRDSVMGQVENIKVSLRRMSVASADVCIHSHYGVPTALLNG